MGQPIVVSEKPSAANRGVIRFETSRMLTGMGHERYRAGDEIFGERPPDELARRLLALDAVAGLHVHGNMITVDLNRGYDADGVRAVIEDLYVFYPDNLVNPPADADALEAPAAEAAAEQIAEATAGPADESAADESPVAEAAAADEPGTDASADEEPNAEAPADAPAVDEEPGDESSVDVDVDVDADAAQESESAG